MSNKPTVCSIAWSKLPDDAQRILCDHDDAVVINLWFETNGAPVFSPSTMGEHLGRLLLTKCAIHDAIRCATEFTESLCKMPVEPICQCNHPLSNHKNAGPCFPMGCGCKAFKAV